jgi:hypothetical protein
MPVHEISIPDFLPTTVNDLLRIHWAARNRLLKEEAQLVAVYARLHAVPPASCRRRVTIAFRAPGGRGRKVGDPEARYKGLLDALVKCGCLVDDSDRWCDLLPRVRERGAVRTLIVLEDLD